MNITDLSDLDNFLYSEKDEGLLLVQYSKKSNMNQIDVKIPPFLLYFDHELLSFLMSFFNGLRKANLEKEEYLRQVLIKSDQNRIKKQSRNLELIKEQSDSSDSQFVFNCKIKETCIDILYKREIFLSIKFSDIDLNYNSKGSTFNINLVVNHVCDERLISIHNKKIIFGDALMNLTYKENSLQMKFIKPKVLFLNRIVMDLVEYFYYIVIQEVLGINNSKEEIKENQNVSNLVTNTRYKRLKTARKNSSFNVSEKKEKKDDKSIHLNKNSVCISSFH
jgi:hypothetical protein